jgi:HEAT repeat protein
MIMVLKSRYFAWCAVLLMVAVSTVTASQSGTTAADNQNPKDRELKLIAVLQSNASPDEKAITCKRLAIYGSQEAVPALAPLLLDKDLSSWARTALEAIPGPAADAALRDAMGKAEGRLLVGVINSIAVRRDAQAVGGLTAKLKDADGEVASAAAVALGRIGGEQAAKVLEAALASVPAAVRPAVAEGCILCAEKSLAQGKSADAVKLYDTVRRTNLPKQKLLEATRGAILAQGPAGIGLLAEQLESPDKAQLGIGLRTARELAGREVTETLAVEINRLSPDRQPLLLLALADRNDAAVLPAVLKAAKSGSKELRITALGVLTRLGNVSCVPVLLDAATESDAELAQAAKETLTRLPGKDVDADLLGRLPQAAGKTRQTLIELTGQRQIDGALAAIMPSVQDADAGIRGAAVQAIGVMGEDKQAADLVKLLQKTSGPKERADIEKALLAISGRWGATCVPHVLPLMQNSDIALRTIGLRALAVAGGPDALAAVRSAIADKDEAVQDEAARTLSTWPNNWPGDTAAAEALLSLAKSGKTMSHQVLGLRGYLQYVRGDKKLNDSARVAKVNELLPSIQRPEEKRLVIGVVGAIRTAGALELLTTLASDPAVAEDACSAIVNLTGRNMQGASREQREKALQMVVEKAKNDATKKKAEDALKKMR